MLRRREFMATVGSTALVSLASSTPAFLLRAAHAASQKPKDNILVVIQLVGGNDGLNSVIPYKDELYRNARPALQIPADRVLTINEQLGFHPALRGFADLLEKRCLSIVQGVGYPNPNRSHFESMDIWHSARMARAARAVGWLGRYLDEQPPQAGDVAALHFGDEFQPLALAALRSGATSIRSLDRFRLDVGSQDSVRRAIEASVGAPRDASDELLSFVQATTVSALSMSTRVEAAVRNYQPTVSYPNNGLGERLKTIAQLIDAGLSTRIYYTSLDGFDTHSTQPDAHSGLLTQLAGSVAAFVDDLAAHDHLERVLVMVFSEFGRRVAENASLGTDHGAAAPMFLAGSKLHSGPLGMHPSLSDLDDGDLRFHTDFRQVYAEVLKNWLGHPPDEILGGSFRPIPILENRSS